MYLCAGNASDQPSVEGCRGRWPHTWYASAPRSCVQACPSACAMASFRRMSAQTSRLRVGSVAYSASMSSCGMQPLCCKAGAQSQAPHLLCSAPCFGPGEPRAMANKRCSGRYPLHVFPALGKNRPGHLPEQALLYAPYTAGQ